MARLETHDFYCINCGRKGIPIARKVGKMHGEFHRKKLYCIFCKTEVNHIEVRNQEEKEIFMEAYKNGEYKVESEESLRACGTSWVR